MPGGCMRVRLPFGFGLSLAVTAAATIQTTHALANFNLHYSSSSSHHRSPQSFHLLPPKQARGRRSKKQQCKDHGSGTWPSRMEQHATLSACSIDSDEGGGSRDYLPSNDILAVDEDLLDEYCEVMDDFGCSAFEKFSEGRGQEAGKDDDFQWIRLENRVDSCLAEIGAKEDVVRRIQEVKLLQEKSGRADLYSRPWQYRNDPAGNKDEDESLQEPVNGASPTYQRGSFSVLQFNMLAEGLSAGPTAQIPFQNNNNNNNNPDNQYSQSEKQSYGGFTDIPHPKISMDFDLRRWRLLEVILGSDGGAPFDLIGLEEIDRYRGFFAPIMRLFGYDGIFAPKTRSPCVRMGWYSDGCAIFWKSQLFELLSERRVEYKVGSQIGIIATLRHRQTEMPLLVAVTHLKAQQSAANESTRAAQVDELLHLVTEEAENVLRRERCDKKIPILILGDFNADPPLQAAGNKDVSSIKQVLTVHDSSGREKKIRKQFQSAYPVDPPNDEFYTTWKIRGPKTSKRIIDYIFYSNPSLECQATLQVPSKEELEPSKLPGLRYPSDHMAIAAIMKLLEDE